MIQTDTREMIVAAYGMGNVPSGTNLSSLCQAFYTRDVRAENKPLHLITFNGVQNQTNPDLFYLSNTSRRALTAQELKDYNCLLNKNPGSALSSTVLDLMPSSPDSIRIPPQIIAAIDSVNSPILRYAAVVMYNTGIPIMAIAGLVKAWKLVKR
ncbi:hypothetical protein Q5692_35660 [Microcoleus sp. C2C3]|uniref:hypothetical protein n=1 Tax=unclassified Microcoleus TaxID=2642155 RepID=UPI002FD67267